VTKTYCPERDVVLEEYNMRLANNRMRRLSEQIMAALYLNPSLWPAGDRLGQGNRKIGPRRRTRLLQALLRAE